MQSHTVTVSLTPDEYDALVTAADQAGQPVEQYASDLLANHAGKADRRGGKPAKVSTGRRS